MHASPAIQNLPALPLVVGSPAETVVNVSPEPLSPFVRSLMNVQQEQKARLHSVGLVQAGLRVRLPEGKPTVGASHVKGGAQWLGPCEPGNYEVHDLTEDRLGRRVARLVELPKQGGLVDWHFVTVTIREVAEVFEVE